MRREQVMNGARWVAVTAGVALCGWLEWHAAVATGLHEWIAVCLPVLIHVYVVTTLIAGRDVKAALAIMWMSVAIGVGVVSTWPDGDAPPPVVKAAIAIWMATVVAVVMYRLDTAIRTHLLAQDVPAAGEVARDADPSPVQSPEPAVPAVPAVPVVPKRNVNGTDLRVIEVAEVIRAARARGEEASVNATATRYGVSWGTADRLHKRALAELEAKP